MGRDGDNVDLLLAGDVENGGGGRLGDDNMRLDAERLGLQAFCHVVEIGLGFGYCFLEPGLLGRPHVRRSEIARWKRSRFDDSNQRILRVH